jgi:hypothetical protein
MRERQIPLKPQNSLTSHSHDGHRAHALPLMDPIQVHLVLVPGLQFPYSELSLLTMYTHHLGLPIPVLELDSEEVKVALGDSPGEAQGVWGGSCHCQLAQEWLVGGLWGLCAGFCGAGSLFLCS